MWPFRARRADAPEGAETLPERRKIRVLMVCMGSTRSAR